MARQQRSPISLAGASVAMACVALLVSACSGQPAPTTAAGTKNPSTAGQGTIAPAATAIVTQAPVVTLAPPAAMKLLWEAAGDGPTSGAQPATYSPAVDPLTGDVWVSVSFDSVIWTFSKDGEFKGTFGKPGKGDGEFNFVRPTCSPCGAGALAFAPDGTLYVADVGNSRIQMFDPKHKFVKAWGSFGAGEGQFADANQIVTNGRQVFVKDDAREDVQIFDMAGTYLRAISSGGWIAVDSTGDLYVSNHSVVKTYHPDGSVFGEPIAQPNYRGAEHIGLALDDHNRLFFDYQDPVEPHTTLALASVDLTTHETTLWENGGELITIEGDVIYESNFVSGGWPKALLRAYELPAP